jgi:predicted ATP-grasp superfamily ATP-dependent carboligase
VKALPSLDTKYPALIFKTGRAAISHGAVGIARTLGRLGVPVYAVVEDACTPLASSRYVTKAIVWESWPGDAFVHAMAAIADIIDYPTILFPIDDFSAISVAENATALDPRYIFPRLPENLPRLLANKASFYSLCRSIGIPCARSIVPNSDDEVHEFIGQATFPIVMKAAEQWQIINSENYNPKIIYDRKALFQTYQRMRGEEHSPILLQEYVVGEDWIYHGYSHLEKQLWLGFTGKKLLDYPAGAGSTALGLSLHNEELCSQTQAFLRTVSYSGICDIDWRRDSRDGQYKILDCNPRVGLNFRMFENNAGIDVVRAQHLDLSGRKVHCEPTVEGRLFTAETLFLRSVLRSKRQTTLTINAAGRPLTITRELAWWSSDDPLPYFVMGLRLLGSVVRRLLRIVGLQFFK